MYESLRTSYLEVFCEMYCQKLQKKAPISESFFNKILTFNFIEKRLQYRCLPMIFLTFFRTTNLENLRTIISEVSKIDGVFKTYISSHRRCSIKKVFLKISQYSQANTCVGTPASLLKIDSNAVVFRWMLKITKSTYFEEHLRTVASEHFSTNR